METVKSIINFCNAAVFNEYKNISFNEELTQARKCTFTIFMKQYPLIET